MLFTVDPATRDSRERERVLLLSTHQPEREPLSLSLSYIYIFIYLFITRAENGALTARAPLSKLALFRERSPCSHRGPH